MGFAVSVACCRLAIARTGLYLGESLAVPVFKLKNDFFFGHITTEKVSIYHKFLRSF